MTSRNIYNNGAATGSSINLFIPVIPVAASRPRVSSYGAYYSKSYMTYRKDTQKFLSTIAKDYPITGNKVRNRTHYSVHTEFICHKPKTPSDPKSPRYDLDNMIKAIWDSITHAKMIWHDDMQIIKCSASKRYQEDGEQCGTKIIITKV